MSFADIVLGQKRPDAVREVVLPRREAFYPSPIDWRDEVIYFLLPDRFSDGQEATRPLLDPANRAAARTVDWRWDRWSQSGQRYQGGTIAGIISKLAYLAELGVTTLWVGPVFKQRAHLDTYHGYAIQDFLEVEPRLGTRQDLVDLVRAAHARGMRVLLDAVVNHTGDNWLYANGQDQPPYRPWPAFYPKGPWRDGQGGLVDQIGSDDDGVWPREFQRDDYYTRAGEGDLGAGSLDDPHAEFRRSDFAGDRDLNDDQPGVLDDLARCYKYWIALTDCDGLRLDALKHVDDETGRNFCGTIKEFAANLGKRNFFLVGEVAGPDDSADRYLQVLGHNLNATLDIGEARPTLTAVAKGLAPPASYFRLVETWDDDLGSHRDSGRRHVSILDDHDHVFGPKVRFSADAASDHQVVAGVALQLFSLGIPCLYYGTEQAFAGPEPSERRWLPEYNDGAPSTDQYLREAMFGPAHPRLPGTAGRSPGAAGLDPSLPGFGPFGTAGAHCFNPQAPAYVRIAALTSVRRSYPVLRYGRQYGRPIASPGGAFAPAGPGELICWSRLLDDEEAVCVVNGNGIVARSADVLVDAALNAPTAAGQPWGPGGQPFLEVVANTAQAAAGAAYAGTHPVGERRPVRFRDDGTAFVEIRDVGPSEVLVLLNRP